MIDLHAHILPGIDDGATDLEEAVAMAQAAAADGTEALFATPHQRHPLWRNENRSGLSALRERLQAAVGPAPRILAGAEVRVDDTFLDEFLHLGGEGAGGEVVPLGDSRYLLIEFARDGLGLPPEEVVHELVVAGWRPILAHPELLPWLGPDLPRLEELVEAGALLQVTAMSLTGEFGARPLSDAEGILSAGLAHFVASDCHGVERRPPGLKRAFQTVARRWDERLARQLMMDHPRAVLEDRPLP
jgi:protein-tyrosine phosphatase